MSGGSIQRRLLAWLLGVLLAAATLTAMIVYVQTREAANALFDYQLRQVAISIPVKGFDPARAQRDGAPKAEEAVVVQIWNADGVLLYRSHDDAPLPAPATLGFLSIATPSGVWRTYSAVFNDEVIQVAQPLRVRSELAAAVALRTVLPLLILLPIIGVLVWLTVGHGLRPIRELASELALRSPSSLEALPTERTPREILPLTAALNGLLARLDAALHAQRAFIADAAHELRTPLTAVRLQLQLAQRAPSEEQASTLRALQAGLDRMGHLVSQLLDLARHEQDGFDTDPCLVNVSDVAHAAVEQAQVMAAARSVGLHVSAIGSEPATILGEPTAIRILLANLIDNGLKYTPAGGRVEVEVRTLNAAVQVRVSDTGPGIPVEERERVFGRFYRGSHGETSGSGLGLAIVRHIAIRHGATIAMDSGDAQGLCVRLEFPLAPPFES